MRELSRQILEMSEDPDKLSQLFLQNEVDYVFVGQKAGVFLQKRFLKANTSNLYMRKTASRYSKSYP